MEITKSMYRDALHVYLKHAYPDDDVSYYSKWAWLASGHDFWESHYHGDFRFPAEVRFGCHCSSNTKLRCYPTGFMFDTNSYGDSQEIIDQVSKIREEVESEWKQHGIPVHRRR